MWSPDDNQQITKDELIKNLEESYDAREYYGLIIDSFGDWGIRDLDRIKAFPEPTKTILREFLKSKRRPKPQPKETKPQVSEHGEVKILTMPLRTSEPKKLHPIPPHIREDLDKLYDKMDKVIPLTKRKEREPGE